MSNVAPRKEDGTEPRELDAGSDNARAVGAVDTVTVSFDPRRRSVPFAVEPPSLFFDGEAGFDSILDVSARALPLTVNVLLVFSGSSGRKFSLEGTDGADGRAFPPFSPGDFLTGDGRPFTGPVVEVEVEAVDRNEAADACRLIVTTVNPGDVFSVVSAGCFFAFEVAVDTADDIDVSDERRGLLIVGTVRAGAAGFGERTPPPRADSVDTVDATDVRRERGSDSCAVEKLVEASLRVDTDDVGRDGTVAGTGGRSEACVVAVLFRIVDACERTEETDGADDFGRAGSAAGARGPRAVTPGRRSAALVPACARTGVSGASTSTSITEEERADDETLGVNFESGRESRSRSVVAVRDRVAADVVAVPRDVVE